MTRCDWVHRGPVVLRAVNHGTGRVLGGPQAQVVVPPTRLNPLEPLLPRLITPRPGVGTRLESQLVLT